MTRYSKPSLRLKPSWFFHWIMDNWVISSGEFVGQKYSFEFHPFLVDIAKDDSSRLVIMKAAQVGVTELMVAKVFAMADILPGNIGYVLPTDDLAKTLSRGRLRSALRMNPYLEKHIGNFDTIHQFAFKDSQIFIRGSQFQIRDGRMYQRQLISIDIAKLFGDEVDEWNQGVAQKLISRIGAALDPYECYFTTPRLPDGEMSKMFTASDQRHWGIKCRSCNHWNVPLTLWDNVENCDYPDLDHTFICSKCKKPLDRLESEQGFAQWVPANKELGKYSGYHLSKLFYRPAKIDNIVARYNDPESKTECFNDDLGLPHKEREFNITDEIVKKNESPEEHWLSFKERAVGKFLGCDSGKTLHAVIRGHLDDKSIIFDFSRLRDFEELKHYCIENSVTAGIIDAQPDFRAAMQFCEEMSNYGDFRVAYYIEARSAKDKVLLVEDNSNEFIVSIARNYAMSKVMFDMVSGNTILPPEAFYMDNGEFTRQMKAPARVYRRDSFGQMTMVFPPCGRPDHYFHAMTYALCASEVSGYDLVVSRGGGSLY